uniref:CCHC-type domain-containing protein n=1 Tax=Seriola dumerili TaxID=41447 RepID=A0A3B4UNU9_SERDU
MTGPARGEREERERRAALTAATGRVRRSATGGAVRESGDGDRIRPGLHGAPRATAERERAEVGEREKAAAAGEREASGGAEREKGKAEGTAGEKQQQHQHQQQREDARQVTGVKYDRELTVSLEVTGQDEVPVLELMRCIRALCGGLIACRASGARSFEITMSHVKGKERLLDGFKIGNCSIFVKDLCNDELMVSFLNLPAYVTDEEILQKLEGWGVSAASSIRRRMWPGTQVADGTRFLKVKFTDKVQSLPYSARFETAMGPEYFRVIHDRQTKVCRMCLQPGHILRECPEFSCHKCGVQGHYARECSNRQRRNKKCEVCYNIMEECNCNYSDSEAESGSEALYYEEEDMSNEEEEGEAGVRGCGTAKQAGSEDPVSRRVLGSQTAVQNRSVRLGSSKNGLSLDTGLYAKERGRGGDGLKEGPEPPLAPEEMEVEETQSDLQPAAAACCDLPASAISSILPPQRKSDSDSEMDLATIKNIRKQHTFNKNTVNKKRKKDKKGKE